MVSARGRLAYVSGFANSNFNRSKTEHNEITI